MCGILFASSADRPVDRGRFLAARDAMRHRGPDGDGAEFLHDDLVALGHRRLAIQDLSEAGSQPMRLGPLWVVFNGELYNYPDLRRELEAAGCVFRSHCDTEALLHGYRIWGRGLCGKLDGMFAFALWDDERSELFLGRDHLGQKPLHYAIVGGLFVVASEIKAITALAGNVFPLRRQAPMEFLVYDYVPEPYTWYDGIRCLLPGHQAVVRRAGGTFAVATQAYWTFHPDPDPPPLDHTAALERLDHEVRAAVASHLLADVEVGAFLSGGVDSGGVVSVASPLLAYPIRSYAIGYDVPGQDELARARDSASRCGSRHREGIVGAEAFAAGIAGAIDVFDQPFGDTSLVPTGEVARLAAQDVKVVLTGDGGDEVFGGYWHMARHVHFPPVDWSSWSKLRWSLDVRRRGLAWWQGCNNFGHMRFTQEQAAAFLGSDFAPAVRDFDALWYYRKHWDLALDPFRRAQWLDLKAYLPSDILVKVDRATMRHSIEARPPFLRRQLVETMMNLRTDVKNPNGAFKGLYRTWLRGRIPDAVLDAPKMGFGLPAGLWEAPARALYAQHRLQRCRAEGICCPDIEARSATRPDVLLRFCLIEQALATGCFSAS